MSQVQMFARLVKVDEANHTVTGILAEEAPDKSGEIFDYATSVPLFRAWNEQFLQVTNGGSVGNLREMHDAKKAAGKFTAMEYDDPAKAVRVTAEVVDPAAWQKCLKGVYTGFSIGGRYIKRWADGDYDRYTAQPSEGSLVDNPCMYGATFEAVKADGSTEIRKFVKAESKQDYKTVSGKKLHAEDFAYVGDKGDISTWKLPIDEPGRIKDAMARFNQTEGIPAGEKKKVARRIIAAAKEHGIDASNFAEEYAKVQKNLADVADVAMILQQLNCVREWATAEAAAEGDGSEVPAKLKSLVEQIGAVLEEMAAEESAELTDGEQPDDSEEVIEMSETAADLAKAGAKHSKATKEHLEAIGKHADGIHEHLKALGAEPEGKEDEPNGKEAEKVINAPQLHKIAEHDAALTKMQSEFADFRKDVTSALTNLAESVKKLAEQPVAPKAAKTVVVDKTQDGAPATDQKPKTTHEAMKAALAAEPRRR